MFSQKIASHKQSQQRDVSFPFIVQARHFKNNNKNNNHNQIQHEIN